MQGTVSFYVKYWLGKNEKGMNILRHDWRVPVLLLRKNLVLFRQGEAKS